MRWLAVNGQPEMSDIVKHYSTFPFAVRSDALEVINIWRNISVKGQKEQIDRFLSEIDQRFAGVGWSRESVFEAKMNRDEPQINRFHCWSTTPGNTPRVMLCLNRTTERRIRGGTYNIERDAHNCRFSECDPVRSQRGARAGGNGRGLKVAYPRLGPISRVGPKTQSGHDCPCRKRGIAVGWR